jgi:hypothetical protein
MAQLRMLESDDPLVGGFLVTFPSGAAKTVSWRQHSPVLPATEAAKDFVIKLIDGMLADPGDRRVALDDIERTNIPSLVAAVQRIVMDWNDKRRAALHAEGSTFTRPAAQPRNVH